MNDSSHIIDAKRNEQTGEMTVTFKGGQQYVFSNVAQEDFDAFHYAPSPGSFLRTWIQPRYGMGRRIK